MQKGKHVAIQRQDDDHKDVDKTALIGKALDSIPAALIDEMCQLVKVGWWVCTWQLSIADDRRCCCCCDGGDGGGGGYYDIMRSCHSAAQAWLVIQGERERERERSGAMIETCEYMI